MQALQAPRGACPWRSSPPLARSLARAPSHLAAWPWEKAPTGPPRPNPKFSRADLKRIKQQGPTLDDVTTSVRVEYDVRGGDHVNNEFVFVPTNVLGDPQLYTDEPRWQELPQVSAMEFHHSLRQRNWTSPHFQPDSEPWAIEFWEDTGRFLQPSFPGYRALVTPASGGRFWVDLPTPGAPTFLQDRISGGTRGANYK